MSTDSTAAPHRVRLLDLGNLRASARALLAVHTQRRYLALHAFYCVVAVALCFVPLLDLLGYEFSLVFALLTTVTLGPVSFRTLDAGLFASKQRVADGANPAAAAVLGPGRAFAWLAATHLVLLLGPLLVITLNALRVRNCDYLGGLASFLLLPGVTVLWATLAALVAWGLAGGRRFLRGAIYFFGFVVGSLAGTLTHLALEPPIVAVSPWAGYFAGSLYDEALAMPSALLVYRALQVLLIVGLVCALELAWRVRQGIALPFGLRGLCAVSLLTVMVGHVYHADLGYSLTRDDIQAALGGRTETEHFVIYHPIGEAWISRMPQIAEDHEFRYWQLKHFFALEPDEKIVSYIYPNAERKGELMGARRTRVAKLWLGEIHITYDGYGDPVLAHELAHVFTAPFGRGPLDLSTRLGLLPNMGLVEGVATAAEWGGREFTPHGWSAALHRLELAPPLASILSAEGFWSRHNRTVYTLMGSFVRWLIDTHGIERFKEAYGDGDLEGVYGESLESLAAQWQAYLATIDLSEADLELARYYFDRPSIFGKMCARNVAARRIEVDSLRMAGRYREAVTAMEAIIALDPQDPDNRHALVTLLSDVGQHREAREVAHALLEEEGLGAVRRAQLQQAVGDLQWRADEVESALVTYLTLLGAGGLPVDTRRVLEARVAALHAPPEARSALRRYFLESGSTADRLAHLDAARDVAPGNALVAYLQGVQLSGLGHHAQAATRLEAALGAGLEARTLEERARVLLGSAYFFTERLDEADALFAGLETSAAYEGGRADASEWRERIRWKRGEPSRKDAAATHGSVVPARLAGTTTSVAARAQSAAWNVDRRESRCTDALDVFWPPAAANRSFEDQPR